MQTESIQWHQVQGNPGLTALNPEMLTSKGFQVNKITKIKGRSKKQGIPVVINFDESYVHYYIIQKIIKPLGITKYNELQSIIGKCWNGFKEKN